MGSSSIETLQLCCQSKLQNPLSVRLYSSNMLKSLASKQSLHLYSNHQVTAPLRRSIHFYPKPGHHFTHIPTTCFSEGNRSSSPHKNFSKLFSEKIVVFLVGSLFFLSSFHARPALSLPVNTTSTQNEEIDNEDMYVKILEKDPKNVEVLKMILYEKMRRGKTKEAVEYVERLISVEPDELEWGLLQALCYEMMGQLSKAKRLFKEILEERPLVLRALHGLAMVMHKNHEGEAVFEMLNKALELARREERVTEERSIKILIAQMHVVKGELEEGLRNFQALVSENPRDFRPYLCQGIIYSLMDKKKEAEEQFETYRRLVPEEFPQRGFLDDIVLAAKKESRQQLQEEFGAEFSFRK